MKNRSGIRLDVPPRRRIKKGCLVILQSCQFNIFDDGIPVLGLLISDRYQSWLVISAWRGRAALEAFAKDWWDIKVLDEGGL